MKTIFSGFLLFASTLTACGPKDFEPSGSEPELHTTHYGIFSRSTFFFCTSPSGQFDRKPFGNEQVCVHFAKQATTSPVEDKTITFNNVNTRSFRAKDLENEPGLETVLAQCWDKGSSGTSVSRWNFDDFTESMKRLEERQEVYRLNDDAKKCPNVLPYQCDLFSSSSWCQSH